MKTTLIIQLRRRSAQLGLVAAVFVSASCGPATDASAANHAGTRATSPTELNDAAVTSSALRLATIAFEASSKPPTVPHAKNRARMQASVIETCAKVGLFKSGMAWAERIEGWQQGVAMTHLAGAAARSGNARAAQVPLARAEDIVSHASPAFFPQEWQRDRIRAGIATALVHLGRERDASAFESDLEPSEDGPSLIARSETCARDAFDQHLAAIDKSIATNHFDRMRHAVQAYIALGKRFATDRSKIDTLDTRVQSVISTFPAASRFDALVLMVECAIERKDAARTKSLLAEALAAIPPASLPVEDRIPMLGRVAVLQFRAGDPTSARTQLDAAHDLYSARRGRMVDIMRASVLRGLAESAYAVGRHELAFELWAKAFAEGVVNPNSRPRADDLVATCCSILRSGAAPTESLVQLADQQSKGLSDPW